MRLGYIGISWTLLNEYRFLLVHFHLEYICQQITSNDILSTLKTLKETTSATKSPLDPTYDRAMSCINNQTKSTAAVALKILSWIVLAKRTLTVDEILVALAVQPGKYELDEGDMMDSTTLLDICFSLVTIDENQSTIQLAHHTVQEYLMRTLSTKQLQDAELELAIVCVTYLSFDTFSFEGACTSYDSFKSRHGLNVFLDYAAHNLGSHLQKCDQSLTTSTLLNFLGKPGCISSYLQVLNLRSHEIKYASGMYDQYPKNRHPVHVASALGHHAVVISLLGKGGNISAPDSDGRTALHAAVYDGDEELVRLLIKYGADTSAQDQNGCSPLHNATLYGQVAITRLLLENKAQFSAQDRYGSTALHTAAFGGNKAIIQLLLDYRADITTQNLDGWTALHSAAYTGFGVAVKLLLKAGCDPSVQANDGSTALDLAISEESEEAIKILQPLIER